MVSSVIYISIGCMVIVLWQYEKACVFKTAIVVVGLRRVKRLMGVALVMNHILNAYQRSVML